MDRAAWEQYLHSDLVRARVRRCWPAIGYRPFHPEFAPALAATEAGFRRVAVRPCQHHVRIEFRHVAGLVHCRLHAGDIACDLGPARGQLRARAGGLSRLRRQQLAPDQRDTSPWPLAVGRVDAAFVTEADAGNAVRPAPIAALL